MRRWEQRGKTGCKGGEEQEEEVRKGEDGRERREGGRERGGRKRKI